MEILSFLIDYKSAIFLKTSSNHNGFDDKIKEKKIYN
jgi:hypothetical protein